MSHKFCSKAMNFSSAAYSGTEKTQFEACLNRYKDVFSLFKQEQDVHYKTIEAVEKSGGDRFAKFNEPDRF